MSIATAIVIAAGWLYAAATRLSSNVSELGIRKGVRRAWLLTGLALVVEAISQLNQHFA